MTHPVRKGLIFLSLFFTALTLSAQDGSYSPYSYYKFGDETAKIGVENIGMGHLFFYYDSIHFNPMMPSAAAGLKWVNYAAAFSFEYYRLRSADGTGRAGEFLVPYITLGIPLGKRVGIGFGFKPYSTSAYLTLKETENEKIAKTGEGGMNSVFVNGGVRLTSRLHAGVRFTYYFGNKIARFIHYKNDVLAVSRQVDDAFMTGTGWTFSLDYRQPLGDGMYMLTGLIWRPAARIESQNLSTLEISDNSYGGERIVETRTLREDTVSLTLPSLFSAGIGAGKPKKWFAGAEFQTENWAAYSNDFFTSPFATYRRSVTVKAGGFWLPDFRSHVKYYKRITYKAGGYWKKGELVIDNQPIDEFGISFGLSLPMNYYFSNTNIGLEYVRRGKAGVRTTEENIFKITIGLSFNDQWFVKRKIR
ncbi:MAG: hypothetical protein GXO27_04675 [Chlorobi bacterium]|nr:hypothetical protein [Chlorobiota bacterium]